MKIKATRNVVVDGKVLPKDKTKDVSAKTGKYLVAIGKAEVVGGGKKAESTSDDGDTGDKGKGGKKA